MVYISVIIAAHKRKNFIKLALKSVLNQTLEKTKYEIIIVKDFYSEIDSDLKRLKVKTLFINGEKLGPKLAAGVKEAKGEIICFLDDDDLFTSNKLQHVYNIFKGDNRLGYYKNNFVVIDEKGTLYKDAKVEIKNREAIDKIKKMYVERVEEVKDLNKMRNIGFENLPSCISVRKRILSKNIKYLEHLDLEQDWFSFYAALASKVAFFYDNAKLTKYRVHSLNTSKLSTVDDRVRFNRRCINTLKTIYMMLKNSKNIDEFIISNEKFDMSLASLSLAILEKRSKYNVLKMIEDIEQDVSLPDILNIKNRIIIGLKLALEKLFINFSYEMFRKFYINLLKISS